MSLLSTLSWWITDGILLDNSTDSSFFLLTSLDDTPYRRMGMSYQVEEIVVPALAHVVGSGMCLSTRVVCGMMDGLAFLPVFDLTNGIHLLRTLCPDDPPEAAELLDYFDLTYISGRLRQQNPAQNQAVRLVLTRSPAEHVSVEYA
jgi:hypothetical protein